MPKTAASAMAAAGLGSRTMRVFTSVGMILCVLAVLAPPARGDNDLDALINAIQNGDKGARVSAFGELGDMGSRGRPAVPAILPFLRDEDAKVREAAAHALAEIGPGPEAIPSLVEAMRDKETGWDATIALVAVGPAAIPALTGALHDSDANVRSDAVYALGEFGPAAKDSMPALIALFAKELAEGRAGIADTWAEIGSGARSVVPLLAQSLRDRSPELRLAAARALWVPPVLWTPNPRSVSPRANSSTPVLSETLTMAIIGRTPRLPPSRTLWPPCGAPGRCPRR